MLDRAQMMLSIGILINLVIIINLSLFPLSLLILYYIHLPDLLQGVVFVDGLKSDQTLFSPIHTYPLNPKISKLYSPHVIKKI